MSSNRLEVLKSMLEQDPANSFARYGVAMEYKNSGQLEPASAEFAKLIETDPNYVAAYSHGGQALEKLGHVDAARSIYEEGLKACSRVGDAHTASEIQVALDLL